MRRELLTGGRSRLEGTGLNQKAAAEVLRAVSERELPQQIRIVLGGVAANIPEASIKSTVGEGYDSAVDAAVKYVEGESSGA